MSESARPVAGTRRDLATEVVLALVVSLGWFALSSLVQLEALPARLPVVVLVLAIDAVVVVLVARWRSLLVAVPVGVASVLAVDWYLIPPLHTTLLPDPENAVSLAAYLLTGTYLGALAAVVTSRFEAAERARSALAEEQAALRRVATLVARQAPSGELLRAVATEARRLLGVEMVTLVRYEPDRTGLVVAADSRRGDHVGVGTVVPLEGDSVSHLVHTTGRPARVADQAHAAGTVAAWMRARGVRATVGSPVQVDDRVWGVMVAASSATELLPELTETHLAQFTELVATAVANSQHQEELRASRARVVAAGDETRRRLERDLHDGVQQRLVSLALNLRLARRLVEADPAATAAALEEVQAELSGTVEDLRELSRGLHPAILSAGGLRPALATLARRTPVPVEVEVEDDLDLPQPVEVGAYYVVAECLTNVVKHAHADVVEVVVRRQADELHVRVADDGLGGAGGASGGGSGLVGLADRVAALGGRLTWSSTAGAGTVVEARVPLGCVPRPDVAD